MNDATPLTLDDLFPFSLDDFQLAAIRSLENHQSVVVCAPTGSGKTLIGEYAIYRALASYHRVFYTTPLKALSNQKYRDFSQQFGPEQVGLLTGDISINRDAPIVVMTTEIFRNMLYGTPIGEVGTSLEGVQAVILDECHYMNDQQRGTVWEESIIYCPPAIQLIALSATIANSDQLTDWMNTVHGPTTLIYSDFRPVPLDFQFANTKGIFPLLQTNQLGKVICNPRLKTKRAVMTKREHRPPVPDIPKVASILRQRDMLPAIYFIFSRKGCDAAIQVMGSIDLITDWEERTRLYAQIETFCREAPEAIRLDQIEPLHRGIAAHHAGLLPAWKGLVETLFQQGLVKLVFATETLAAGINMPARTTVISSLSKRTDNGHRLLTASEFMQMSGRAGRRGKDVIGYVVTVQSPFEGAREAAYLATSGADPLVSQFTPSYGMVLNLLQKHSLATAKDLVNRSFGQYLLSLQQVPLQHDIEVLKTELASIDEILNGVTPAELERFEKMQGQRREEKRSLRYLQKQLQVESDPTLKILAQNYLYEQEQRLATLEAQIQASPAYTEGQQLSKLQDRRHELQRKLNRLRKESTQAVPQHRWEQFLALADVLTTFNCLDDYRPTITGEVVAALRGDNELWLGLALLSGDLVGITPSQLAGVFAALVTETPRSGTMSRLSSSDVVLEILHGLKSLRRNIFKCQRHYQVYMPVWLEHSLAGLVEHWAMGIEWDEMEQNTNLDAGDMVRLIRRTLDLLSQIPHAPHLPREIKETARQAQILLDRFPISEMI